ncbi:hypothetical protein PENSPDRAFT_653277 [Peniophora sp. CONT]|nr:hypothetical protein PENSPDRAFT_653277 [Peniophora sp. CONT]
MPKPTCTLFVWSIRGTLSGHRHSAYYPDYPPSRARRAAHDQPLYHTTRTPVPHGDFPYHCMHRWCHRADLHALHVD